MLSFLNIRLALLGLLSASLLAGLFSFFNQQPFRPIDDFVLFGEEGVHIAEETQSTSGDIGSNKEIKIAEKVKVVGNLFGKEVHIGEQSEIDGNVFAKKLKIAENVTIFGTTSKDITFPVAKIPEIPSFTPGTQDITIATSNFVLPPGSYRDITIKENASAILSVTYNLRSLRVAENGAILFDAPTTLNIKEELKLGERVIVNPKPTTLSIKDIKINYAGTKPLTIGERAILGFRLIAPKAKVHIGEEGLLRGAVWGKEVKIGENSILSKSDSFSTIPDPTKVVKEQGVKFIVNEIVVLMSANASVNDMKTIAEIVGGKVTGFLDIVKMSKIEIPASTLAEVDNAISAIKQLNHPLIVDVLPNAIIE